MKHVKIIIIAAMIIAIVAFSAGCGMIRVKPGDPNETVVAKVNDENITKAEFDKIFEIFKIQVEANQGTSIWDKEYEGKKYIDLAKEQVLNQMINDKVQLNKAKELGITVSDEEVNAEMDKWKKLFNSDEKFVEFLESLKMDEDYFKANLIKDLTVSKVKEELTKDVQVTDNELVDYYGSHINLFQRVKASHILLDTEEEAGKILERAKAGEDFGALAKEFSTDTTTAEKGGDLGYFRHGEMVEPFEQAAFALKPGEISGLVKSDYGYHIIKVEDKTVDKFEDVKDELRNTLITEKKNQSYNTILDDMKNKAKIEKFPKNL